MFRISLYPTQGKRIWIGREAAPLHGRLAGSWCIGVGTYKISEKRYSLFGHADWALATSALESTAYFGSESGRQYFAVGIGSVFGTGWQSGAPILSKSKAIRFRDDCRALSRAEVAIVRPEMIFSHGVIPDAENRPPHDPSEIGDEPCMLVYSSAVRWRLSDLFMLRDSQRKMIFGVAGEHHGWLQRFLIRLGENWRLLRSIDSIKWKPSMPGIFIDGSFDISVDKSETSITEIASNMAEMMRLPLPASELRRWIG